MTNLENENIEAHMYGFNDSFQEQHLLCILFFNVSQKPPCSTPSYHQPTPVGKS